MSWTEISPPGSAFNCLLSNNAVIRVQIPNNNRYVITGDNNVITVNGSRYEVQQDIPEGGQCPDKLYQIDGWAVAKEAIRSQPDFFGDDLIARIGSFENPGPLPLGPIETFEQLPPGSSGNFIDFILFKFKDARDRSFPIGEPPGTIITTMSVSVYGERDLPPLGWGPVRSQRIHYGIGFTSRDWRVTRMWWQRFDGTSVEDDVKQCGSKAQYTVRVYDCKDKIVFNGVYKERPSIKIETDVYDDPVIIKQDLYRVMAISLLFFIEDTPDGPVQCLEISLQAPLLIGPLPPEIPVDDDGLVNIVLAVFRSPICEERPPKAEIQCDCFDQCPSNTICVVKEGDKICCYDINGEAIDIFDDACIEADIIC